MSWEEIIAGYVKQYAAGDPNDPKERKKQRILDAATDLFVDQGYRKTSMDEVAREAGVAKGTLYLYFKNKSDLLIHAIAREKFAYMDRLMPLMVGGLPPAERLRTYLVAVFELVVQMRLANRMLRGDLEIRHALAEMDVDFQQESEQMRRQFLTELLEPFAAEHGWSDADVAERVTVFIGLLMSASAVMDGRHNVGMDAERYAAVLADILFSGIGGQGT